jgi:antitoxin MazE
METITKIRSVGNSRGILLPKSILSECGIDASVKITVKGKSILISPVENKKGKTWSDIKKQKQKADWVVNKFDEDEWTW